MTSLQLLLFSFSQQLRSLSSFVLVPQGNKYEGDLLLAEDQLLYGAWNQKVRMGKSKSSGRSIFGSDLASDLGCIADLTKRDDIKVGFGRRNPNATKFGRERRGKKKKNVTEKACGLRRY